MTRNTARRTAATAGCASAFALLLTACGSDHFVTTPSPTPTRASAGSAAGAGDSWPGIPSQLVKDDNSIRYGWGAARVGHVVDTRTTAAGDTVAIQPVQDKPAADGTVAVTFARDPSGPKRETAEVTVKPHQPGEKWGITVSLVAIAPDPAGGGRVQLHIDPPRTPPVSPNP